MVADYSIVTEIPGIGASREQIERFYQRYHFARQFCKEKDVLELACGAGQGLGYLAAKANSVIGADIDKKNLEHITEKFFKGNMKSPGSGLGLAITSEIVELHGGLMEIESIPGNGTTISVLL